MVPEDSPKRDEQPLPSTQTEQSDSAAIGSVSDTSTSTNPNREDDLADVEARTRVAKLNLEIEKLVLEKQSLRRELSWQGITLEWVKAASVFAALIGVATTLYLGQRQTELARTANTNQSAQAEEARAADRFDKALARLADRDNGVRMTGIAGLRLFLNDGNDKHQRDALHYLVTAIAEEKSPEVQQEILDAFVDAVDFSQAAKDDALRTAIELDRSLTKTAVGKRHAREAAARRSLLAKFFSKNETDLPADDSALDVGGLPFLQRMQLDSLSAEAFFAPYTFNNKSFEDTDTLDKLVIVIDSLVSGGAKNDTKDWTNLYCQRCKFDGADLVGAHFDRSFLGGATFARAKLRGATFQDADLSDAVFFASDLTNADLSWHSISLSQAAANAKRMRANTTFPYLECATLIGANLTNLPLGMLSRSFSGADGTVVDELQVPIMAKVTFDAQTKLDALGLRLELNFDNSYYAALTPSQREEFEADFSSSKYGWLAKIGEFGPQSVERSSEVSFDGNGKAIQSFTADRVLQLGEPKSISEWAKPLFSEAFDKPVWKSMSATRAILAITGETAKAGANAEGDSPTEVNFDCSQKSAPQKFRLRMGVSRTSTPRHSEWHGKEE